MKAFLKSLLAALLALGLTGPVAIAEERPPFSGEELDQMLAPIALYPDSLLSQILMASTYPLEVVQAARWSRANSQLKGDDAVKAVESMDWDPSVKSLVAFPQILHRMDERLDWTQRLGEAFLAQEPQVLDAIQGLRQRAAVAGNLSSNEHLRVTRQDEAILIDPVRSEAVYVPYYNPAVVYGPWAWTGYPPVYWAPFPGYYAAPAFAPAFFWGPVIVVSTGFFFGHCNWHHRHVIVHHKHGHFAHAKHHHTTAFGKPVAWTHDPMHRKSVPYRYASLHQQFGQPGMRGGDGWRNQRGPGSAPSGSQRLDSASQSTPGNDRRSDAGRDGSRFRERGAGPTPATREAQRADLNGRSNIPRFSTPQAGPSAPVARQDRGADTNGNNVHRFQGHVPAPRSAPSAPAVRQDLRPAAPQRSAQPGT
ncbi:MAG: DUF3300 domain-containing protein, partial [Burkholderiales bacterium]